MADWRPARTARTKLKKREMGGVLRLVRNPDILNASRKRRVAAGSGTTVQEINLLLKQFEEARKMMKQFMGKGKRARMRMPFGLKR